MKLFVLVLFVAICGTFAQEGPKCASPDGRGLQPVFQEFASFVPTDKILELIYDKLSYCHQTQRVFDYLKSSDFRQIIDTVQSQPAFKSLIQYFCTDLHFDLAYYLNQLSALLGWPEIRSNMPGHGMGFKKLLHDILAVIPTDDLQKLLEERLATDHYLQLAFQKINSDEFGTIIEALQANAAYTDMKDRFRAINVDVDYIIDALRKIFKQ